MGDRRPYARTLAVLHVLSWPYRYPPLSWWGKFIDWVIGNNRRFAAVMTICALTVIGSIVWKVTHG